MNKGNHQKPLISTRVCYKVGLIKVRSTQAHCPVCSKLIDLNTNNVYNYCPNCGQHLDWTGIHINKDEFLGYVDEVEIPAVTVPRSILVDVTAENKKNLNLDVIDMTKQ